MHIRINLVIMTKKKNGRPRKKFTQAQLDNLPHFASTCSDARVAELYGMDHEVFAGLLKEDKDLNRLYKKAKAEQVLFVTSKLMENIGQGKEASIFFYLKCIERWKESRLESEDKATTNQTVTVRVVGADGKLITPSKNIVGK